MINLLPGDQQKEIRAARSNTLLLRYLILLVCATVFLIGALGITYFTLAASAREAEITKEDNERAAIGYQETQSATNTLRSELAIAKALFDKEVRFSKVLLNLSALLPEGTSISELPPITAADLSGSINLRVQVNGKDQAQRLEQNFKDSTYVTSVTMNGISVNSDGPGYIVDLNFTFNRSALS